MLRAPFDSKLSVGYRFCRFVFLRAKPQREGDEKSGRVLAIVLSCPGKMKSLFGT